MPTLNAEKGRVSRRGKRAARRTAWSPLMWTDTVIRADVEEPLPSSDLARRDELARHARISEQAYLKAEQRHFAPGHELEDWMSAEADVDEMGKVRDR